MRMFEPCSKKVAMSVLMLVDPPVMSKGRGKVASDVDAWAERSWLKTLWICAANSLRETLSLFACLQMNTSSPRRSYYQCTYLPILQWRIASQKLFDNRYCKCQSLARASHCLFFSAVNPFLATVHRRLTSTMTSLCCMNSGIVDAWTGVVFSKPMPLMASRLETWISDESWPNSLRMAYSDSDMGGVRSAKAGRDLLLFVMSQYGNEKVTFQKR